MRLMLLGPLLLIDDAERRVTVAGPRQRVMLAALAAHANQPVSTDALAEFVWDGVPPPGGLATVRTHLVRLRRALGPGLAQRIVTCTRRYVLELGDDELDLLAFEHHCRNAGTALRAGDHEGASASGTLALGLWRGEPLCDVPSQLLRERCAPRLERQHVQAVEDWIEAELRLGRHGPVLERLRDLTARHPLRERFHAQLILALYRGGRQAEALAVYRDARAVLVGELGVEPGPELRRLHERILAGDDDPGALQPKTDPGPAARPRQLPTAAGHFTGRHQELGQLIGLTHPSQLTHTHGGTVVICAVDGMAGIGKTALAVHAAHRLAERFPGGQLFVDLHGYTKGHLPREPGQALEALLRALGVAAGQIPEDTEERAALYRQRLSDTKTLILLDNALDEAQVRPLLPAAPGCLVLVTSRRRLKGLDDALSISLDLLPPTEATALLRTVAGPERIPAHDPQLGEVAELCGHLPLALRIAGALLRHRPAWSLQRLAELLRDQRQRLTAFTDGERDLSTVFHLSYTALGERHRLLFRRLGLIPGPDTDAYATAALLECDPSTATGLLEDLVDHSLLTEHTTGRYRLHDLIRAHAAALAVSLESDPERDTALDRLLHYYAHTAQTASVLIAQYPRTAPDGPRPAHVCALPDPEAARAWLRAERENLEAAFAFSRACALDGHVLALAAGLAEILRNDGPFTQAAALHQAAAETAERHGRSDAYAAALAERGYARALTGDFTDADEDLCRAVQMCRATGNRLGEANALTELGRVRRMTGDYPAALDAVSRAVTIYRASGRREGEAAALTESGRVRGVAGDYPAASKDLRRALQMHRATGNRLGEANALTALGSVHRLTGDLPRALDARTTVLEIYRELGNRDGEAIALINLADLRAQAGDRPAAFDDVSKALEIHREVGNRRGEAIALTSLGDLRTQAGDYSAALEYLSQALDIYRKLGNRANESWALNYYAAAVAAAGDLPRATSLYQQALAMNRELNNPENEAVALEGLGECHLAAGEIESAADHLRQALEIFERLGMTPDTDRVRNRLAALATR